MTYSTSYLRHLASLIESLPPQLFDDAIALLEDTRRRGGKVVVAGNGASAAMASHMAVDLTKVAGIRGVTFNEADLITCFANDYGYENWIARALEHYVDSADAVVLISSSGASPSVVNAAEEARRRRLPLLTLTGFSSTNPLSQLGSVNLWVDDHRYNLVEATHQAWVVAMIDAIAGVVIDPTV